MFNYAEQFARLGQFSQVDGRDESRPYPADFFSIFAHPPTKFTLSMVEQDQDMLCATSRVANLLP